MIVKRLPLILAGLAFVSLTCYANKEQIVTTTVCEVVAHPDAFNHKLIKISGQVTHGFKQLTIAVSGCEVSRTAIWLEYGGKLKAPSVYDPKDILGYRPSSLVVEGIPISLVNNALFKQFDKVITEWSYESRAEVTIIGRYFAGHQDQSAGFESWNGYGHQACCSLLVIERVLAVKPTSAKPD